MDITEGELQELYSWVDEIPLSRPKRNIARDFSDAVLLAEIIHHYFPKYVDLHNYSSANGVSQKLYNWNTLNQKFGGGHGHLQPPASASGVLTAEPEAGHRLGAPAPQQQEEAEGKGRYVQPEMVAEREQAMVDLQETNEILETKVRKLEQLVRLKDAKIQTLLSKLHAAGLT